MLDATDPALNPNPRDRARNLAAAESAWTQVVAAIEKMLKRDPANENWKSVLADAQVHLGTTETLLHRPRGASLAGRGLPVMKDLARKDQASVMILDQAASDFTEVEPESLRDPQFAVRCAERAAAMSHRQKAGLLLSLARAYRAVGAAGRSSAAATEGLALLQPLQPGSAKSNTRKLLEIQARRQK